MRIILLSYFLLLSSFVFTQSSTFVEVPGYNLPVSLNPLGISVLPSGRFVKPAGKTFTITHDPFGLAISPNGQYVATLHDGVLSLYNTLTDSLIRIPDYQKKIKNPFPNGSLIGVQFSSDNHFLFLSGGDNGTVIQYDIQQYSINHIFSINGVVNGTDYKDSFTSDLILNEEKKELLVLDLANYRLVRLDYLSGAITTSIQVGRLPFGIALSPDKRTALVANVGMYEYPLIKGITKDNYNQHLIAHHPYGNNTHESINGTTIGDKEIPGVGSPNVPESMSVYTIDLDKNTVTAKLKTGYQVGQIVGGKEIIGGASPNSIAVGMNYAYVTNATNDNIAVIDYRNGNIVKHIPLAICSTLDSVRGYIPFGLSLSKDETRLYVALFGLNSVAVVNTLSEQVEGLIPTGWGPTRVKLTSDNKELYIVSCRGYGAGPNGGKNFVAPVQGTYVGDIQLATLQRLSVPTSSELTNYTKQVIDFTFIDTKKSVTEAAFPFSIDGTQNPIKYIVYVTKENRTYDEIFGDLPSGHGDSTLARFGLHAQIKRKDSTLHANVSVTPNHHKLASQFSISDNFYCDSDASIHGHHWMMGVIPNEWVEANSNTSKTALYFSTAPGRRFPGSTGSMDPEDYAEIGGLWEALERNNISFYNFGEANETAHVRESWLDTATGAAHGVMVPMQKSLFSRTSQQYAGFNTNIPDQFRLNQFEKEFTDKWLKGKERMPALLTIQLPNDHGASPRPEDGYPFLHSYIADNDLALGRMLHFLSRTPYWKNMLVVITEDDPQGGVDHIDAHRSLLMMAGPYVKKGYISSTHANFGSILKTIYTLFHIPYVNQYDLTATLLNDFFMPYPDYTPYTLEKSDLRIFNPTHAMKKYNRDLDWKKIMKGPEMDDEAEIKKINKKND